MVGAAAATSVGYGAMFLFHVVSARHLGFDPLADARLARIAVTVALAAVPILAFPTVIGDPAALVVVPPVGLGAFLACAFATGALDRAEVRELLRSTPLAPYLAAVERRLATDGGYDE